MRNPVKYLAVSSLLSWAILVAPPPCRSAEPDVQTIIEKSVEANQLDFKAAPQFTHREQDRTGSGSKTFQVLMIDGSPYRRLIAVNDEPLPANAAQQEEEKLEQAKSERKAESSGRRQRRIAKYEKERRRNNAMMQELTKAFTFHLIGECKLDSFDVYKLEAKPRPGYNPPNLETQVLPAMEGQLWIDKVSYQWVKVTAKVIRPASIEGFLAQVEPGTQFELEKMPVGGGVWLPKHFAMKSQAKVLFLVNQNSHEDDTFFDYHRVP
ncbi:MAG: hypothetical protein M3Y72_08275 [Acidobacteriota bacterium]|nr:hypothetical protein [Acidobacteriota bacterium]